MMLKQEKCQAQWTRNCPSIKNGFIYVLGHRGHSQAGWTKEKLLTVIGHLIWNQVWGKSFKFCFYAKEFLDK